MAEKHAELLNGVARTVLSAPGETDPALRRAISARTAALGGSPVEPSQPPVPSELSALVEKIGRHAYKVTDEDIAQLKAAGFSEDALFEIVVSAAMGAGLARYERGMKALRGEL
jgi:hypothetical protein